MIEFDLSSQQPHATRPALTVTVIGLGGAGTNILDTIALEGLPGAQLVALNTDARALQSSMLGVKLQLGTELTRGLGTGGDPDLGAEAVRASEADIREELSGQKMVFLCTGLGGGTGSGAGPLVARMAREQGAFVVVFAVMPFAFEGRRRLRQAEEALAALRQEADALITFDNDRLGEVVLPKKGIHEAFAAADKIVSQSIRAIINLVTAPGLIRIGMDELIAAVGRGDTRCLFGYSAEDRAGRIWFGTNSGAYAFDGKSITNYSTTEGLTDHNVNCILEDRTGRVWFATHYGGVCYLEDGKLTAVGEAAGVRGEEVWDLFEDRQGHVWFPVENAGVYRFDGSQFRNYSAASGLDTNAIQCTHEDAAGRIWLGGYRGLFRVEGERVVAVSEAGPWR